MSRAFCGMGFFCFLIENKDDRDLIFNIGPYFMGSREMHLNKWIPNFILDNGIPSAVPIWVCLAFLPLHSLLERWNLEKI
jgi:hypothetical protein